MKMKKEAKPQSLREGGAKLLRETGLAASPPVHPGVAWNAINQNMFVNI